MGKYRKRFNEKARAGMLAKQAALKKARNKQFYRQDDEEETETTPDTTEIFNTQDSNSEILAPVTEEERLARKRALEQNLYSENSKKEKMSRAKKKRLDKYIDHQLKREEKKILLEKLAETKMDTSNFAALKELGKGKQTKKEEMIEALELERQGRADENTREVLYEERDVKDYDDSDEDGSIFKSFDDDRHLQDEEGEQRSTFVDNRPKKFGGQGSGFGFANIPVIKKDTTEIPKKKYSWRKRVEEEEKKRLKKEDDDDFASSSEDEEELDNSNADDMNTSEETVEADELRDLDVAEDSDSNEEESEHEINPEAGESAESEGDLSSEVEEEEDDDDDDDDEEEEEEESKLMKSKPRHSTTAASFKEWAEQQVRIMEGRNKNVLTPEVSEEIKKKYSKQTVRDEDVDHSSDEEGYIPINKEMQRRAFVVEVNRTDSIQQQRVLLPVFAEEHRIMEAVYHHDCIILCGETGSGKTTQVPQFLYEAGFGNLLHDLYPGMIGVTQPRRVAAVSMAERVGSELGDHGHRVGYQIRFDTTIKNEGKENGTALKFMTDGVLLREMMTDFLLAKYSAIIIDEAHERNINTDILIGMLTRVVKLRRKYHKENPQLYKPLKLIIMSATLRVSDFSENPALFKTPPPIINVQARQYPVSIHFNKKTNYDYLEEAFKKTCKIHRKLPEGGILIFLTGQNEITTLVKKLRQEFPFKKKSIIQYDENIDVKLSENVQQEVEDVDFSVQSGDAGILDDYEEGEENEEEEEGFEESIDSKESEVGPLYVLPLYSLLPTKQQMKVFEDPPPGSRICIVATNVAETSLTIPGIRYVVDCGRSKERKYNQENGVQSFEVDWVSKASANQRAGRAGRTGPGHCYRLYSSAVFEDFFPQFSVPEILRMPFESIVLSMKSMGIDQIANFPFPTPPDRFSLKKAEELLVILGALDKEQKQITDLGKKMSLFPLSPRFAKILIIGNQQECLSYIIAIVSALSVGDPFIGENELVGNMNDEARREFRTKFYHSRALFSKLDASSNCMMLLSAVCAYDHVPKEEQNGFLQKHYLRHKMMEEIQKLRKQVGNIVENMIMSADGLQLEQKVKLPIPNKKQVSAMKQMIASGFIDQVAIRGDLISSEVKVANKTSIINIPYCPVMPIEDGPFVYLHPNSLIAESGQIPSSYLVYQSLSTKGNISEDETKKVRMNPLVDISGKQLANIAKNSVLLTYSKPLGHPYAPKNLTPTKRECYVVPRFGAAIGSGGVGWDLPAIKVIQEKRKGVWVNL